MDEKTLDELVIAQADDEDAWYEPETVKIRDKRESRQKFLRVLNKVPTVEPAEEDKID